MSQQEHETEVLDKIVAYFKNFGTIPSRAESYIRSHFYFRQIKKAEQIIMPGQLNENLYFVLQGVMRGYIKTGETEITTWINEENEIVGSIRNYGMQVPSEEYVQALENTDTLVMPIKDVEYLYDHFPETNKIGRLILEESYRDAEERAFICRIPSAEARYQRFIRSRGSLENRIPLKFIANYLGMKLETLSRIRSKRNRL